jgi:hypothetical protein
MNDDDDARGYDEGYADGVSDTETANSTPTIVERQAREKLAALKREKVTKPEYGRYMIYADEVFELIEQAGLELPR